METSLSHHSPSEAVTALVRDCALEIHAQKGLDVRALNISAQSSFADFFIIATAQSFGHLKGLVRVLIEWLHTRGIEVKGAKRTIGEDDAWVLLDASSIIIHLFTKEGRAYYDLEKLWFESPQIDLTLTKETKSI